MFAWKKIAMASKQCVTVICLLCGLMSHCKTSFPLSFTRFSEFVPVLNGLLYVCLITLSRVINSATAWPLLLNKIKQIIFSSIVSNFKETNCSPIPPQKRIFSLLWFQIWKGVEKNLYHPCLSCISKSGSAMLFFGGVSSYSCKDKSECRIGFAF